MMAMPKIGNLAPKFTLLNQEGEKIALKDLQGQKVILYFYPKAMTPGCTTQACDLRDMKKELKKYNAIAVGVSPDPVKKLKGFEEKKELNFTLLSDEDHAIAEKYGVWGQKKFMGKEYIGLIRTTFIINEEGRLTHIMDKFKTKSHGVDVIEILKEM